MNAEHFDVLNLELNGLEPNRVANIRVTLCQWRLMTVFHVFDDEPSAVRSFAWGLRT